MRKTLIVVAVAVVAAVPALFAAAADGSGPAGLAEVRTSGTRIETPSATYQDLTTLSFDQTSAGVVIVELSGQAYAADYGRDGSFLGRSRAVMQVRVLLDGAVLPPGQVRFVDNTGREAVSATGPSVAKASSVSSFLWAGQVGAGSHTLTVQFRSARVFDVSGFLKWSLAVQHG